MIEYRAPTQASDEEASPPIPRIWAPLVVFNTSIRHRVLFTFNTRPPPTDPPNKHAQFEHKKTKRLTLLLTTYLGSFDYTNYYIIFKNVGNFQKNIFHNFLKKIVKKNIQKEKFILFVEMKILF